MAVLQLYIDESYNSGTFCVGGWLGTKDIWDSINTSWLARIAYENRVSAKHGFSPISRYHATYCANLKREFGEKNGWTVGRQIRLSKRLCQILGDNSPVGFVVGGGVDDFKKYFRLEADDFRRGLYGISLKMLLVDVAYLMNAYCSQDKVSVYYDRSGEFGPIAEAVFNQFTRDPTADHMAKYFVDITPKGWEACVPLQPADLLVYECMKRLTQYLKGIEVVSKALRALLGHRVDIYAHGYTQETYDALLQILDNKDAGRPLDEAVTGSLAVTL